MDLLNKNSTRNIVHNLPPSYLPMNDKLPDITLNPINLLFQEHPTEIPLSSKSLSVVVWVLT